MWVFRTENVHNFFQVAQLVACRDEISDLLDRTLDGTRDLIDILGLDDGLQVILQNLGEVVCF